LQRFGRSFFLFRAVRVSGELLSSHGERGLRACKLRVRYSFLSLSLSLSLFDNFREMSYHDDGMILLRAKTPQTAYDYRRKLTRDTRGSISFLASFLPLSLISREKETCAFMTSDYVTLLDVDSS